MTRYHCTDCGPYKGGFRANGRKRLKCMNCKTNYFTATGLPASAGPDEWGERFVMAVIVFACLATALLVALEVGA